MVLDFRDTLQFDQAALERTEVSFVDYYEMISLVKEVAGTFAIVRFQNAHLGIIEIFRWWAF